MGTIRLFSLILLLTVLSIPSIAQLKVGIKIAPGINPTRITSLSDTLTIEKENKPLIISPGLVLDFELRDNYEFRTGIQYLSKKLSYTAKGDNTGILFADEITAQYLQIPLSLRLLTNEIMLDMKAYFQLGAGLEIKVADDAEEIGNTLVNKVGFADVTMIIATGVDYKLGTSTKAFGGIFYNRGFLNQASETLPLNNKFKLQSGFVGLEVGIIF